MPALQRKWLRGRLQLIARRYGLGQANIARVRPGGVWSGEAPSPVTVDIEEDRT